MSALRVNAGRPLRTLPPNNDSSPNSPGPTPPETFKASSPCSPKTCIKDPHAAVLHANGLMVLTLAGGKISALTRFDNSVLSWFGLPRTLSE
jgi:hypothetical protein